jgi:hypothetical protein
MNIRSRLECVFSMFPEFEQFEVRYQVYFQKKI